MLYLMRNSVVFRAAVLQVQVQVQVQHWPSGQTQRWLAASSFPQIRQAY
jgi:hypothetical protein